MTVHGIRDDTKTAWGHSGGNRDWIKDKLFGFHSVRQLDYAYDTSDSARIYDPSEDGITMEANDLLDSVARKVAAIDQVRGH